MFGLEQVVGAVVGAPNIASPFLGGEHLVHFVHILGTLVGTLDQ